MRSLPEIKAMNAAVVDRNVSVHLRARQADIYEKALRRIIDRISFVGTDSERDIRNLAITAVERAERLR